MYINMLCIKCIQVQNDKHTNDYFSKNYNLPNS